jgi:hypothetical protein
MSDALEKLLSENSLKFTDDGEEFVVYFEGFNYVVRRLATRTIATITDTTILNNAITLYGYGFKLYDINYLIEKREILAYLFSKGFSDKIEKSGGKIVYGANDFFVDLGKITIEIRISYDLKFYANATIRVSGRGTIDSIEVEPERFRTVDEAISNCLQSIQARIGSVRKDLSSASINAASFETKFIVNGV